MANVKDLGSETKELMRAPIFVTGLHRSGTTWVGNIVAAASKKRFIHEPLNLMDGMRGVPCWYPYHPGGITPFAGAAHALYMEAMLHDLVRGGGGDGCALFPMRVGIVRSVVPYLAHARNVIIAHSLARSNRSVFL